MAGVHEQLAAAGKDVLVDIVKLVQKQDMIGEKGDWKKFLDFYDKQMGSRLSDPSKRKPDVLLAFLKTFNKDGDLKFFGNYLTRRSNLVVARKLCRDPDSPEEKLLSLTLGHPLYQNEYSFPSHEEGWVVTKLKKKTKVRKSKALIAVDCEMVLCEDGTEAVVKICVVDRDLQVKLHELVKPDKAVLDYRTSITGVSAQDLDGVTISLDIIQKSMTRLLSHGAILVGHSLNKDLKALKIDHSRVIDTGYIFQYGDKSIRRVSLDKLCQVVLGYEVRKQGDPHNCVDDARAAMKLVLAKIDRGLDGVIPRAEDDMSDLESEKLFIHKIPISLPSEELSLIIPGKFTVQVQSTKKARANMYNAFAVYKNPEEAVQAFQKVPGNEDKDSFGRPQKSISVKLKSGSTDIIYIRKMTGDEPKPGVSTKKRPHESESEPVVSKKSKPDETPEEEDTCVGHLEELKRLKKLVEYRDQEISNLHKIIAAMTRKQGL